MLAKRGTRCYALVPSDIDCLYAVTAMRCLLGQEHVKGLSGFDIGQSIKDKNLLISSRQHRGVARGRHGSHRTWRSFAHGMLGQQMMAAIKVRVSGRVIPQDEILGHADHGSTTAHRESN